MTHDQLPNSIEFNIPKKYKVIEKLGEGACGITVQIRDESMDSDFVVKKYSPIFSKQTSPNEYASLLKRFRDEARILFRINHPNIVRIFNFYDYKEAQAAYIIMEMIKGSNLIEYASKYPAELTYIFEKTIDGFFHLEQNNILHRDIRPFNLLVAESGEPKIIDFGFGKQVGVENDDEDKSISLNWWCEVPPEFKENTYDFQTEIYFVGKLFEEAIKKCDLSEFKYLDVVSAMCRRERSDRPKKFSEIREIVTSGKFQDLEFDQDEVNTYRTFAGDLFELVTRIDGGTEYNRDVDQIIKQLADLHRNTMLEWHLPEPVRIARIFIKGGFRYQSNYEFGNYPLDVGMK